jgi:hypothetical protein
MNIENRVIEKIRARAEAGFRKYGTTMDRRDLSIQDWLQHLQEELMDASVYAEKLLARNEDQDAMLCIEALAEYFGVQMPQCVDASQALEALQEDAMEPKMRIWKRDQAPAWVASMAPGMWTWVAYVPNAVTGAEFLPRHWHPLGAVGKGNVWGMA